MVGAVVYSGLVPRRIAEQLAAGESVTSMKHAMDYRDSGSSGVRQ